VLTKTAQGLIVGEDRRWISGDEARRVYRGGVEDMGYELEEQNDVFASVPDGDTTPGRGTPPRASTLAHMTPDYAN